MTDKATSVHNASILSSPTISRPYWSAITPRWICRFMFETACVPVTGGRFRLNTVVEDNLALRIAMGDHARRNLPKKNLSVTHGHSEDTVLNASHVEFDTEPRSVQLETIQAVLKMRQRVSALYSDRVHQLREQIRLTAEYIYETKENLIFNHPEYGLLNNVAPALDIDAKGAPTPDLLDDMLSRVWRMPDFFVMHPETLEVFRREANKQGLMLNTTQHFGASFTTWRGLPILPSNKLHLVDGDGDQIQQRVAGKSSTDVLLMRIGEPKQGVISLFAAGTEGTSQYPFISVDTMGIDGDATASYLMTTYAAMAVLTPGALARARVVI